MNVTYFQPPGIKPTFCEAGVIFETDPDYIFFLSKPCKILKSEVKIIPEENVVYDRKRKLYCVQQQPEN